MMKTIPLRTRLLTGFSIMAIMVLGFAGYMLNQESLMREGVQTLAIQQAEVQTKLEDLREILNAMQRNAFHGAINHDRKLLYYATTEAASVFQTMAEMRKSADTELHGEERTFMLQFLDQTEILYREIMPRSFVTMAEMAEGTAPSLQHMDRLRLDSVQINSIFADYLMRLRGDNAIKLQEFNNRVERLRLVSAITAAMAILAMGIFLVVMRRYLTKPLLQLDRFVSGITEPAIVTERAPVIRNDEIGIIAAALNRMLDGLQATVVSRDHFNHVLANLSNALIVVDRQGIVDTVNTVTCTALGREENELVGKPVTTVLPAPVCALLAGASGIRDMETELHSPAGVITPVLISAEKMPSHEGGWVIVATDITERRKVEEQLRRSEERYRQVIENVSEGILVAQDAHIVFANPSLQRLIGYSMEELLQKEFLPFVHPDDQARVLDRYMRRLGGEPVELRYDCRVVHKSGAAVWVDLAAVLIQWEGRPATLSFVSDITERKRIENELRLIKDRYDIATAVGKVGTWDWNPATGTLVWSDETFRLMGYAPSSVTPTYELYLSLVHPDDREMLNAAVREALSERKPYDLDCRIVLGNGTLLVCHVTGKVEFAPDGNPVRMLGTIQDVTTRKQAEQDIQDALEKQKELNYLKSRFVSMTSHEFRTPLSTILSSAELLKHYSEKLPPHERRELIDSIENGVKRMTQMLEDILIIGRAEAGHLEFRPEILSLRPFCENLVSEIAKAGLGPSAQDIELLISGKCDTVLLDQKLLQHILSNLLSNAVKYSPQGGRITFGIAGHGQTVEFTITDHGIGMPAEDLPRMFETFFRARNVGNISGTGLGLAIVKRSVDLHGGTIQVQSKLGEGTRFTVSLPCTKASDG